MFKIFSIYIIIYYKIIKFIIIIIVGMGLYIAGSIFRIMNTGYNFKLSKDVEVASSYSKAFNNYFEEKHWGFDLSKNAVTFKGKNRDGVEYSMVFGRSPDGQTAVKAREKMAHAATMAGMAFANAFLGIGHSLAHKLGAYHHLPHGICCALLITNVMKFNANPVPTKMGTFSQYEYPKTLEKYAEVARYLGLFGKDDKECFKMLCDKVEELKERVGCKKTIADYGISEEDFLATLDQMSEDAFDDQCTGANPRYPLIEELKEIYKACYYGTKYEG